jgi:hypothetical protein
VKAKQPTRHIYRCACGYALQQASKVTMEGEVVITFHPCPRCMDRAHDKGRDFDGGDIRGGHSR